MYIGYTLDHYMCSLPYQIPADHINITLLTLFQILHLQLHFDKLVEDIF